MYLRKPNAENEKKYLQATLDINVWRCDVYHDLQGARLGEVPDEALVYGKCHCYKLMPGGKKHYLMAANR